MANYRNQLQKIVDESTAAKIDGTLVDLFSASALLQVYDAVSPENLDKLTAMPVGGQVLTAFRILNKAQGN